MRGKTRYIKQEFGYVAVYPDGQVSLLSDGASGGLSPDATPERHAPYRLDRIALPRTFHFSAPLIVWLEITGKCNLRCPHCYSGAGEEKAGQLETGEILHLLGDLAQMGVVGLILTGGEPTLHPDIIRIVERADELGFVLSMATNGTLLTPELLERYPKNESFICLSLDGFEAHKTIRSGSTHSFVERKLEMLGRYGIQSSIMTTISHANIGEVLPLVRWARDRGTVLRTVPFVPIGRGKGNRREMLLKDGDLPAAAMAWALETEFELRKNSEYGLCIGHLYDFCLSFVNNSRRCKGGRSLAYIDAGGEVYPCSNCRADGVFSAGNIKQSPFPELWQRSFHEIRSIIWDDFPDCGECELSGPDYFCTNRCPQMGLRLRNDKLACGAREFDKKNLKLRTKYLNNIISGRSIEEGIDPSCDGTLKKLSRF